MSKVMQVLEQMGSDANCQSEDAINNLLVAAKLDPEITEAIVNKEVISLERQLDVCPDIVCFVVPAEEDENDEQDSTEEQNFSVIGF